MFCLHLCLKQNILQKCVPLFKYSMYVPSLTCSRYVCLLVNVHYVNEIQNFWAWRFCLCNKILQMEGLHLFLLAVNTYLNMYIYYMCVL